MNITKLIKTLNKSTPVTPTIKQTAILGISGTWTNKEDIVETILKNGNNTLSINNNILTHLPSGVSYELDIYEYNPSMWLAYKKWSKTPLDEDFLDLIDTHTFTIYLVGPAGSVANAQQIAGIASIILQEKGLGVKIETTGVAYTAENWLISANIRGPLAMYSLFIRHITNARNQFSYTCGLHNLGFKDVTTRGIELNLAIPAVLKFNTQRLANEIEVKPGMTYTYEEHDFLVVEETTCPNSEDEYYGNPWGMWLLTEKS